MVCYVNTTAEVKAESDVCCTSSNAVRVVNSIPDEEILFVPDKNLAAYVARQTGKKIIAWDGCCYVHDRILAADVLAKKRLHPEAEVWVHPECRPEVIDLADRVISTGHMVTAARDDEGRRGPRRHGGGHHLPAEKGEPEDRVLSRSRTWRSAPT